MTFVFVATGKHETVEARAKKHSYISTSFLFCELDIELCDKTCPNKNQSVISRARSDPEGVKIGSC